jgi:hypothetical protein
MELVVEKVFLKLINMLPLPKEITGFFNQLAEHKKAKDRDWNRKLFIEAKTSALLQQLSIAENLLGLGNIQAALNKANAIWEDIQDRGESPTKKLC